VAEWLRHYVQDLPVKDNQKKHHPRKKTRRAGTPPPN
jgi:hypothetical protein